jgi:NDP-sugar pyrophosphorylase family protein
MMLLCVNEHTMENLGNYKIKNISVTVNWMDNKLRDYLSNSIKWDRYVRINAVSMTIVNKYIR